MKSFFFIFFIFPSLLYNAEIPSYPIDDVSVLIKQLTTSMLNSTQTLAQNYALFFKQRENITPNEEQYQLESLGAQCMVIARKHKQLESLIKTRNQCLP